MLFSGLILAFPAGAFPALVPGQDMSASGSMSAACTNLLTNGPVMLAHFAHQILANFFIMQGLAYSWLSGHHGSPTHGMVQDVEPLVALAKRRAADSKAGVKRAAVGLLESLLILRARGLGGSASEAPTSADLAAIDTACTDTLVSALSPLWLLLSPFWCENDCAVVLMMMLRNQQLCFALSEAFLAYNLQGRCEQSSAAVAELVVRL